MAAQHTPGRWVAKIDRRRVTQWSIETDEALIADVHRCIVYGKEQDGEAEANARLIAAAPQMLEALKAALSDIEAGRHIRGNMIADAIAAAEAEAR